MRFFLVCAVIFGVADLYLAAPIAYRHLAKPHVEQATIADTFSYLCTDRVLREWLALGGGAAERDAAAAHLSEIAYRDAFMFSAYARCKTGN